MLVPYKELVLKLLDANKYPILVDYVVFNIYYKRLKPVQPPTQRFAYASSEPSLVYEQMNLPFKLTCFTHCPPLYFDLHYESPTDLDLRGLPTECKSVKIDRGLVNRHLRLHHPTFEFEIYEFLARLNFNLNSIHSLLDLSFVESTCFLPVRATLFVHDYTMGSVVETALHAEDHPFGVGSQTLEVRVLEGRLSECTSPCKILSLRDHYAWKDMPLPYLERYSPYNIHYVENLKAYVPLAFNPLENPVITT